MNKSRKVLYTIAAGFIAGAIVGILYAPDKGSETRRRLRQFKDRFSCGGDDELSELDRAELEDISNALTEELEKINKKLAKSA